jgi:hypothetical protein
MKSLALPLFILASAGCLGVRAQFSVDWSTIDSGGDASSGGAYSVTGTTGQPDAGTLQGGSFTLSGGSVERRGPGRVHSDSRFSSSGVSRALRLILCIHDRHSASL